MMTKMIVFVCFLMVHAYSAFASSSVVAIKEKEIVTIKLDKGNEVITLNKGKDFINPQIFDNKKFVAYQDSNSNLYVSSLSDNHNIIFQMRDVKSYTLSNEQLIFSKTSGGVFLYDVSKEKLSPLIKPSEFIYAELLANKDGLLFYQKVPLNGGAPLGLFEFDRNTKTETLIVDYVPISKESFGTNPKPVKVSADGNWLYVWCEATTASARMDGGPLGVYNVTKKQFKKFDQVITLSYLDNLAINPISNDIVGVINGEWRFMNEDKHLQLLNIESGNLKSVTENNMASMTPSFSHDGTKLFYSARVEVKDTYTGFVPGANQIYTYDLKTKKTEKLTHNKATFDFYPQEVEQNVLLFLQFDENKKLSLVRRDTGGKESIILTDLLTTNLEYYGHLESYKILNVKY